MESQSPAGGSVPAFDLQWDSSCDHSDRSVDGDHDGYYRISLRYTGSAADDLTVEDLIGGLSIDPELPDSRATWHRNYTLLSSWVRAQILKQAMGWNGETQLADYFAENPELTMAYGFVDREYKELVVLASL